MTTTVSGRNGWLDVSYLLLLVIPLALMVTMPGLATQLRTASSTILGSPTATATLRATNVEAEAQYRISGRHFELTVTFTEIDGASLSTRAVLADGQRFAVAFEDDDQPSDAAFAFLRRGNAIEMTLVENATVSVAELR